MKPYSTDLTKKCGFHIKMVLLITKNSWKSAGGGLLQLNKIINSHSVMVILSKRDEKEDKTESVSVLFSDIYA